MVQKTGGNKNRGVDYDKEFKKMKTALSNSVASHFPDYELDWTLRVDASKVAVGAVLSQSRKGDDGQVTHEADGFSSKKFSDVPMQWDTIKKESYACLFGIEHLAYYLRGKPFVLETDLRSREVGRADSCSVEVVDAVLCGAHQV